MTITVQWGQPLPAPAKLNLFLHVLGRRADGYHRLETLFRLIDLQDTLRFEARSDASIRLAAAVPGLAAEDDLCVRAARALREAAARALPGVDIHLEKRIPMGGGLGGGSSDAATTLLALNALWRLDWPVAQLAGIAARLGADVPFFLGGGNAYAEGTGGDLTPVALPPAWYVVLNPGVMVPTAAVFADPELTRDTKSVKISGFSAGSGQATGPMVRAAWPRWAAGFGANDLEAVVCRCYPEVALQLAGLQAAVSGTLGRAAQPVTVRMSGSGACVFAELSSADEAQAVLAALPPATQGWVARGLDRHPLLA